MAASIRNLANFHERENPTAQLRRTGDGSDEAIEQMDSRVTAAISALEEQDDESSEQEEDHESSEEGDLTSSENDEDDAHDVDEGEDPVDS